ncbi:MAG: UDP-N-acetyl glucosamine 2-epimerase [Candidatus Aminicenantaceae bacterium]
MNLEKTMRIISVVGARPQFIKLAPFISAIKKHNESHSNQKIEHSIVHTGQHYDYEMNKIFFDELGIPEPDVNLEVGSGTHGIQTGEMMKRAEQALIEKMPNWILVYGDTNSTLAGALAAVKLHILVGHVESGLRSYNRKMPEEINRILTDHCSAVLFCPTENAVKNLMKEGFPNIINKGILSDSSSIELLISDTELPVVINIGDIMYDTLLMGMEIAEKKSTILEKLDIKPNEYYLATIHRAENTDNKDRLRTIIDSFVEISEKYPLIFPVHPRTRKILEEYNIPHSGLNQVLLLDPISYFDMLILEKNAYKILTDSGGVQKEAYLMKIPCITLRDETEWIETVESGFNILSGITKEAIVTSTLSSQFSQQAKKAIFGNGQTSQEMVKVLIKLKDLSF